MATSYVTDKSGTYIPATQRPDGTWRKARRVKDGYVPQDEVPLYESKGKQWAKNKPAFPPGLHPDLISQAETAKADVSNRIPGLNPTEVSKSSKKKKKKKQAKSGEQAKIDDVTSGLSQTHLNSDSKNGTAEGANANNRLAVNEKGQPVTTDPVKRLRNLKKKLRDIEILQEKIDSGKLEKPEKEQLEKISRKSEIEAEIEELELELES